MNINECIKMVDNFQNFNKLLITWYIKLANSELVKGPSPTDTPILISYSYVIM